MLGTLRATLATSSSRGIFNTSKNHLYREHRLCHIMTFWYDPVLLSCLGVRLITQRTLLSSISRSDLKTVGRERITGPCFLTFPFKMWIRDCSHDTTLLPVCFFIRHTSSKRYLISINPSLALHELLFLVVICYVCFKDSCLPPRMFVLAAWRFAALSLRKTKAARHNSLLAY